MNQHLFPDGTTEAISLKPSRYYVIVEVRYQRCVPRKVPDWKKEIFKGFDTLESAIAWLNAEYPPERFVYKGRFAVIKTERIPLKIVNHPVEVDNHRFEVKKPQK